MVEHVNGHEVAAVEGSGRTLYQCRRCEKSLSEPGRFESVRCVGPESG